jgi:hypothetical protein
VSRPFAFARSSQKSGSPSAISKANRSRGRRTGLKTRGSNTFSVFARLHCVRDREAREARIVFTGVLTNVLALNLGLGTLGTGRDGPRRTHT